MTHLEARLGGFFDELEKTASLAAAAKFGVGVLLGSMLWNSLGKDEKEELKDRAQSATGDRKMPPIIILQGQSPNVAVREMAKADPHLPEVMRELGQLRRHFPADLRKMGEADPVAAAATKFRQSRRVAQLGTKKPTDPNIRAVATKI
jgi:hypothetical protein